MLKTGQHSISVNLPSNNELFDYESYIDGKKSQKKKIYLKDDTNVFVEVKRIQKFKSSIKNHKLTFDDDINYYEILGLKPNCTQESIKKAYIKKIRSSDSEITSHLRKAYDVLSDNNKRKQYDRFLEYGKLINNLLEVSRKLLNQENYSGVKNKLDRILEIDKENDEAYCLMALFHFKENDFFEAAKNIEKAISLKPLTTNYWLYAGQIYKVNFIDTKRPFYFEKSEKKFRVAIDLEPYNSEPYLELTDLYFSDSSYDEALKFADEAINADEKIDFNDFEAMFQKVKIYAFKGDPRKSKEISKEILGILPDKKEYREFVLSKFIEFAHVFYKLGNLNLSLVFIDNALIFSTSKELIKFKEHIKKGMGAFKELESFSKDTTIIKPFRDIVEIIIYLDYGEHSESERKNLQYMYKNCVQQIDDNYMVRTVKHNIYDIQKHYPGIYRACSDFFESLNYNL